MGDDADLRVHGRHEGCPAISKVPPPERWEYWRAKCSREYPSGLRTQPGTSIFEKLLSSSYRLTSASVSQSRPHKGKRAKDGDHVRAAREENRVLKEENRVLKEELRELHSKNKFEEDFAKCQTYQAHGYEILEPKNPIAPQSPKCMGPSDWLSHPTPYNHLGKSANASLTSLNPVTRDHQPGTSGLTNYYGRQSNSSGFLARPQSFRSSVANQFANGVQQALDLAPSSNEWPQRPSATDRYDDYPVESAVSSTIAGDMSEYQLPNGPSASNAQQQCAAPKFTIEPRSMQGPTSCSRTNEPCRSLGYFPQR